MKGNAANFGGVIFIIEGDVLLIVGRCTDNMPICDGCHVLFHM